MPMSLPHALDSDLLRAFVLIAEGNSFTAGCRPGRAHTVRGLHAGEAARGRARPAGAEPQQGRQRGTDAARPLPADPRAADPGAERRGADDIPHAADRRDGAARHAGRLCIRLSAADPEAVRRDPSGGAGRCGLFAVRRTGAPDQGGRTRPDADLRRPPSGGLAGGAAVARAAGLGDLDAVRAASAGSAAAGARRPQAVPRARAGLRVGGCRGAGAGTGRPALSHRLYLGLTDRHACAGACRAGGHRLNLVLAAGGTARDASRGGSARGSPNSAS